MGTVVAQKRAEARSRYYTREEAQRLGWDVRHPTRGGKFLEEQEIVDYFPPLRGALGGGRPDFAALASDQLLGAIIECKNDYKELDVAIGEAKEYANAINSVPGFDVRVAVGVAGAPDSLIRTRAIVKNRSGRWVDLTSHKFPLTQLPTPDELSIALSRQDGTTDVELPSEKEFFDAAVEISRILRLAKIDESARPKVIGAIIVALHHDDFSTKPDQVLEQINLQVAAEIDQFDGIPPKRRRFLVETLRLSTEAHALRGAIGEIVSQLERLNVRSILRSGVDFLGKFYETFLRYGMSAKNLGVVFTPRHITRLCAELADVRLGMTVYDPAAGTGGFLVAAFDRMWKQATKPAAQKQVKESLYGCETFPVVWALSVLNMYFRGDGKSHLFNESCFEHDEEFVSKFDRVLLNPPFSQEGEPETDFVQHALKSLKPGGEATVVVPASVLVDRSLREWRKELIAQHQVLGVISLPADLFYPVTAPTAILSVRAHTPSKDAGTFLANIENDGFEISKNRRVECPGDQIPQVLDLYRQFVQRGSAKAKPGLVCVVDRASIENGDELVAQRWLPSAQYLEDDFLRHRRDLMRSMSLAVAQYPDITDELVEDFEESLASSAIVGRPTDRAPLGDWFEVVAGITTEAKNHPKGSIPYLSSGDAFNSIDDFLEPPETELFAEPCATVTGFGQAYIQPWRFCLRGGAGSAPHVLRPRYAMTLSELFWLVGQINAQRWRFYYGRMAVEGRLAMLELDPPPANLPITTGLIDRLRRFQTNLETLYATGAEAPLTELFAQLASLWRSGRGPTSTAASMSRHPAYRRIVAMGRDAVPMILRQLEEAPDHWFVALHEIVGHDPVPASDRGNMRKMTDAWLKWGRKEGLLTNEPENVVPKTRPRQSPDHK